jgi:hypothetical protein
MAEKLKDKEPLKSIILCGIEVINIGMHISITARACV